MKKSLPIIMLVSLLAVSALVGCSQPSAPQEPTAAPTMPVTEAASPTAAPKAQDTATSAPALATVVASEPTAVPSDTPIPEAAAPAATDTAYAPVEPATPAAPTPTASWDFPVAAVVNGQPVPLEDYETQVALAEASFARYSGGGLSRSEREEAEKQVRRQVLDWLIDQLIIEQAAARLRITISDEHIETELAKAQGDDPAGFGRWLQENNLDEEGFKAKLRSELLGTEVRNEVTEYFPDTMEQVRLRHIVVATRAEAEAILRQIQTHDDFVRLAKEHSLDLGTADQGGDLGFYPRGVLSPEIDRVAFNLVTGQISDVIQTSYGYHIIQVMERASNRSVSEEMLVALRQQAFMDWLIAERGRAQVEILIE